MPKLDERTFRKTIQARQFEPVYYLFGDEELLKEAGVRDLVDAAVEPATRDFNLDVRSAGSLDAQTLGSLLNTPPMMAERRMVIVRETSALRKEARAVLDRYLSSPSPDVLLVLVEPGGERGKADKALTGIRGAYEVKTLTGDRVPRWVTHHAEAVHGRTITPEATDLLIDAVGNDLPALAAELDKLASYASGGTIDETAVSAIVGVRRGETMADLLTLISRRDAKGALAILAQVLELPKVSGVTIVMALTVQLLGVGHALALLRSGVTRARLFPELMDFLKSGSGPFTGMSWGDAVKAWMAAVSHWDDDAIDDALDALLDADVALKQTTVSSEEQILTTLILRLCVTGRAA